MGVQKDGVVIIVVVDAVAAEIQSHRQKISAQAYAEMTWR
jgi:hypothetical protein